jgi:hypothetical protein
MKKKFLLVALGVLVIGGGAGAWWWTATHHETAAPVLAEISHIGLDMEQKAADVLMPAPLRGPSAAAGAHLTRAGVILETNMQRKQNGGLAALEEDAQLDGAAQAKLKDLFAKQYFEHISPTGVGPADLAKTAGYAYAVIGENLALGNFKDDAALVQAWMDSPGHRANILFARYTQIGVAVGRGTFEGHATWIAVQEFGRPQSDCPTIDTALQGRVEADEASLKQLVQDATVKKAAVEAAIASGSKGETEGYDPVDEYNALIRQINALNDRIRSEISGYNEGVRAYNACANAS